MNVREKAAFIRQQIRYTQAKGLKVTAVRLSPKDKFRIDWNSFQPVIVKFDNEVSEGQFVLETDAA
jgi:hypothetical protein